MNIKVPIKILRNIVSWIIEKNDLKFSYSKQLISILNNNTQKDGIIEVPTIIIKKLLEYIEYLSCYDKLGRYGDFYYKLKLLIIRK